MFGKQLKKVYLFPLLWMVITLSGACGSAHREKTVLFDSNLTVEANIASNVITLENNNSFDKLDCFVKDKRIVILGEAGHWDSATFEVKTNWIKHLHVEHGFDVIALEALEPLTASFTGLSNYECPWTISHIWGNGWADRKENQPLIEMINNGQLSAIGIDFGPFFVAGPREYTLVDVLRYAIEQIDSMHSCPVDWNRLRKLYYKSYQLSCENQQIPPSDMTEMMELFNQVNRYAALLSEKCNIDTGLIHLSLKNNKVEIQCRPYLPTDIQHLDLKTVHIANNYRDRQMADNLIWYLDRHPDKKVIVWCANFHGARDISEIDYPQDSLLYYRTQLMGEHLADKYGDELYSVAFTTSEPISKDTLIGTLEKELAASKCDFGFIDFTALRYHPDYFGKKFNSSIIRKKNGRFHVAWDGVYYIRKEHKAVPVLQQ